MRFKDSCNNNHKIKQEMIAKCFARKQSVRALTVKVTVLTAKYAENIQAKPWYSC